MKERSEPIEPAWLVQRLDPEVWLSQPPHPKLLARDLHAVIADLAGQREAVRAALRAGDELWTWREVIGRGPSGAWGYALVRGEEVVRSWVVACIL